MCITLLVYVCTIQTFILSKVTISVAYLKLATHITTQKQLPLTPEHTEPSGDYSHYSYLQTSCSMF